MDAPVAERWNVRLVRWTPIGVLVDPVPVAVDGTATFALDERKIPVNNPLTAGTGIAGSGTATNFSVLSTHSAIGNVQYAQGFHTGTAFSAAFNNTRASTSSTQTQESRHTR